MNTTEKIEFLNKYTLSATKKVDIITDKTVVANAPIPNSWKQAFLVDTLEERKSLIIAEWENKVSLELRNTILYLKTYLQNVELMKIGEDYSILYTLLTYKSKKEIFYEGKPPVTKEDLRQKFDETVEKIDSSIINFYIGVHNGFYDFTSKSLGLDSLENIYAMIDYDWEYIDDLDMDLSQLFNFFSSGMGAYVVLDLNKDFEKGAYIWSTREHPKGDLNFWDVIDDWIIIGLDF